MPEENVVLQPTEQVSETEQVSASGETTQKTEIPVQKVEQVQSTPEEILNQKITEAVSRALAMETEKSRRELQSFKDKSIAEVSAAQRRAKYAESTSSAIRTHLQTADPEVAKEMELIELRAKEQGRQTMEQEEAMARQQVEFHQQFHSNLTQFITGIGVDSNDKRIDWANDAPNYLEAQRRVLDSVTKIQKENVSTLERSIDIKIKEAEKRIKKDLGQEDINSVSTQVSGGVSGEGIPTNMVAFRKWIADVPQEEYEKKYASKVNEMMRENKIK